MSISSGPRLVTDGLVQCLDAANIKSYTGSGATWADVIGFGNYTMNAGYSFSSNNNGYIEFDGAQGSYASDANTARTNFGNNSFTLITFIYPTDISSIDISTYARICEKTGFPNCYFLMQINATGTLRFEGYDSTTPSPKSWGTTSTSNLSTNTWYMLTCILDRTNNVCNNYINATQSSSAALPAGFAGMTSTAVLRAPSTYAEIGARFGNFLIYNKALSNTEIKQTYNAFRGRYGLS